MELNIIDAHTHVQFPEFEKDREDVIDRALSAGIGMVNAGADMETSRKAIELARRYEEGVWATVGIHPTELPAPANMAEICRELTNLADDRKVVGIGECGLDYFRSEEKEIRERQREVFILQIELARKAGKPLVLHIRPSPKSADAFEDALEILSAHKNLLNEIPGTCHFFTGTRDTAKKFLNLGFFFTFGGLITYNRDFDEVLEYIPADRILVETDAPFVSPKSHRGHRNEPVFVRETAEFLAGFKKISQDIFLRNTKRIFGL